MRLIGPAHFSQFMERHNSGIKKLKHAIYITNVFSKLPENQIINNSIYLTSTNFVAISCRNYWDLLNSWKNFFKFCNISPCRNKSGSSPYSVLQYIDRVATPKLVPRNCLRCLQKTLITGGGDLVSGFMWDIVTVPKPNIMYNLFWDTGEHCTQHHK